VRVTSGPLIPNNTTFAVETTLAARWYSSWPGDDHSAELALPGAQLFEPMSDRPMREWVQVPWSAAVRWPELARAALRTVRGTG
jgi:hypothetical protein